MSVTHCLLQKTNWGTLMRGELLLKFDEFMYKIGSNGLSTVVKLICKNMLNVIVEDVN